MKDFLAAMLHTELFDLVGTRVNDWVVAILHMNLLAMIVDMVAMVEDYVVAMS